MGRCLMVVHTRLGGHRLKFLIIISALLLCTTASAQESPPAQSSVPTFATLDRQDGSSHFDASLAYSVLNDATDVFNLRLNLHAQYVTPGGAGGYISLPYAYSYDSEGEGALGNLDLGGIYAIPQGPTTFIFRGGLMVATADDNFLGITTNLATGFDRLTDFASVFPETQWLRLSTSATHQLSAAGSNQGLYVRADIGLDVPIDTPEGADIDPLWRLNLGLGYQLPTVAIAGELVNIGSTDDFGDPLHTLAVSARGTVGKLAPFGAVIVPVDSDGQDVVNVVVMGGLQVPIAQ